MSNSIAFYILVVALFVFIIILFVGMYRTWKMQHGQNQGRFINGNVPKGLPDGFYRGTVTGYEGPWIGKEFDEEDKKGINVFKTNDITGKQHPFLLYKGKGLQDKAIDVIKIDYNTKENPFWVRIILDEIVEINKDEYLGKVHVKLIPGIPFTVGYFNLKKSSK